MRWGPSMTRLTPSAAGCGDVVKQTLSYGLAGALLFTVALCSASPGNAQAVYGSLFGTVTDSSGAVVANAKVTVTDIARNTAYTASTNESGHYEQIHLIVGKYRVRVEGTGFQSYVQEDVDVSVDAAVQVKRDSSARRDLRNNRGQGCSSSSQN
jgi:hypothetical protein